MNDLECPQCGAVRIVKNGFSHNRKQRYLCRVCGHQFTLNHVRHPISAEQIALVDRLLTERISYRGICRAVGVSRSWFRLHLKQLGRTVPHEILPEEAAAKKV